MTLIKVVGAGLLILDHADGDRVHRTDLRAEAAAHTLLAPRFGVRQEAHRPPEARRQLAHGVRVLDRDRRLEQRAQGCQEPGDLVS
jgi:transposase